MSEKIVMPTFDLPTLDDTQVEDLEKKSGPRLEPGLYAFEVTEAAVAGPSKKDANWLTYNLTLAVTGGTIKETVMLPTKGYTYGEKQSKYPLQRLREFLDGVGAKNDLKTFGKDLKAFIGKDGRGPVGLKGEVRLDYRDNRLDKVGDKIKLVSPKGEAITDDNGDEYVFDDFASAREYCTANNIRNFGFPKPVSYTVKATAASKKDDVAF